MSSGTTGIGNGESRGKKRRLALVASKGTLDMAYPPLILGLTAASLGWEVGIFFTFYGLTILKKGEARKLKVAPVANPAMPVPVPNIVGALPGMTAAATAMMKKWIARAKLPRLEELLAMLKEAGVTLYACSTTMAVMGVQESDLIEGVSVSGAAAFLDFCAEAQVQLFI